MKAIMVLILAAGLLPLAAQDTGLGSQGSGLGLFGSQNEAGIQGAVVLPENDLRNAVGGRTGFGLGVHGAIAMDGGTEIRPRIDYTRLDGGSFSLSSISSTTTVQEVSVGADYLVYAGGTRQGLYGFAGANLAWWYTQNRFSGNTRKVSPTLLFGPGFRFNKSISGDLSFEYGQFRSSVGTECNIKGSIFYSF